MEKSIEILRKFWGYDAFRPLQEEIVDSVIYGHDTFAILPTGGGKSICFQVPGLALEGLTLVISPLIALMEDQVKNLNGKGIQSILITSAMSYREIDISLDNARFGNVSFLYTSPERLKSDLFIERFKQMKISLIVVDEAHCISEWGHDFRPAYQEITAIRTHHPKAPIIALTASATEEVQLDIIKRLELHKPTIFKGDVKRDNLIYEAIETENKLEAVLSFCTANQTKCGIVYCQTRKSVKDIVKQLRAHKLSAGMYHGGMNASDRSYMLELWMKNQLRIMVSTNAFGMGIDKPDVNYVLHFETPNNLEAYYQEAGRAGRDGNLALARAFWNANDVAKMHEHLSIKYPAPERVKSIYSAVCNFLQVAIGSGEMEVYSFDIVEFSKKFSFPISEVYHSIKLLELNENVSLMENNFFPTRLKFTIGSSALYNFQVAHDATTDLITLLSRSYPGIFDRYVTLNEAEFMKRLKIDKNTLRKLLEYLEKYGVIEIRYQSVLPQLTLLTPRIDENQLQLNHTVFLKRKQTEETKLKAIEEYLTADYCRSALISIYFGFENVACGKCDNCRKKLNNTFSIREFENQITPYLPMNLTEIGQKTGINEKTIKSFLRQLILEEKLMFKDEQFHLNS